MTKLVTCDSVTCIDVPTIASETGALSIFQGGEDVPFSISRVFTVNAGAGEIRGHHAHRECAQFLVAVSGKVRVVVDDGAGRNVITLDNNRVGLLIPPSIWAEQTYLEDETILMVLCSHAYNEGDYVRDYKDFLKWRSEA